MNAQASKASQAPVAPVMTKAITLRQRLAMLSPEFAAQEHARNASLEQARQHARKIALEQAKNNLSTANYIGKNCSKLGGALKRIAMQDINSLSSLKNTARVASVMGEYSNFGTYWNA
jgi:hypothetical protein